MKNLDLSILTSQIENVFTKYNKEIPKIDYIKFSDNSVLIVGVWEFYFTKAEIGYLFSDVINSSFHTDDNLVKIKSHIICDLLDGIVLPP